MAVAAVWIAAILPTHVLHGAPAAEIRARVGVYGWGAMPTTFGDPLVKWVSDMQSLGTETVRVALTRYWDPRGSTDRIPIDQLARRPDYAALFGSPGFNTILITAYPLAMDNPATGAPIYRSRSLTADELLAVHREMSAVTSYLRQTYPGKTFIFSGWESEHDAFTAEMWPAFLAYTQEWINGIREGAAAADAERIAGAAYTMFEFVNLDDATGRDAAAAGAQVAPFSGLLRALPVLRGVDFWSYSSWNSMRYVDQTGVYNRRLYHQAFAEIRAACLQAAQDCSNRIVIGEIGYLRNYDSPDATVLAAMIETCLEEGARYVINWVAYDQNAPGEVPPGGPDLSQYGKFTLDGAITSQGQAMQHWYSAGLPMPVPRPHAANPKPRAPSPRSARAWPIAGFRSGGCPLPCSRTRTAD